jgi:hypothetical protein
LRMVKFCLRLVQMMSDPNNQRDEAPCLACLKSTTEMQSLQRIPVGAGFKPAPTKDEAPHFYDLNLIPNPIYSVTSAPRR